MLYGAAGRHAFGLFLVAAALIGSSPSGAHASPYGEAIARALRLLPRQPEKIVLVERLNAACPHKGKPNVEAFIDRGGRTVYLVRQGVTIQGALKGPGIFDHALAAIIWHEMAHIDGADESAAQQAEEQLWREFILRRQVDGGVGMRYLALLQKHRSPRRRTVRRYSVRRDRSIIAERKGARRAGSRQRTRSSSNHFPGRERSQYFEDVASQDAEVEV